MIFHKESQLIKITKKRFALMMSSRRDDNPNYYMAKNYLPVISPFDARLFATAEEAASHCQAWWADGHKNGWNISSSVIEITFTADPKKATYDD